MTEKETFIRACISAMNSMIVSNGMNGVYEMIPKVIANGSVVFAERLNDKINEIYPPGNQS